MSRLLYRSLARLLLITITLLPVLPTALAQPGLVSQRTVAPGVVHAEYLLSGPNTLDVLSVSLKNPFITLESFKPNGLTKTSVQAAANDREGHRVIGAVNADFFSFETGWPVGNQVVNGMWALGVQSARSHLAIDTAGRAFIERLAFSGTVTATGGSSFAISGVNTSRGAGTIVLYTPFRGSITNTDATGMECPVTFLEPFITAGDTLLAVAGTPAYAGGSVIPAGGAVLSAAAGPPSTFLSTSIHAGDTLQIVLGFNRPLRAITQVLGGAGRFLLGGRNVTDSMSTFEGIGPSFTGVRHPRTFVGFDKDTTTLFLCTVDGRQSASIGMTFAEMASFLVSIGASEGFNLDGGGSTTMLVRSAIVNAPSDPAGERSVANTLQVISTAPTGSLHRLDLQPKRVEIFQGGMQQFTASAFDEYHNPITLPPDVTWESDASVGTISSSGNFTAAHANDSGWVRVRRNTVIDSAFVVVRMLTRLFVTPSPLVMVPGERVTFRVKAEDNEGHRVTLDNRHAIFSPSGPALDVDGTGVVTARDFATGFVTIALDTLTAVVPFDLRGTDTSIVVERFSSLFHWDTSLVNLSQGAMEYALFSGPAVPEGPALRVAYDFPDARASVLLSTHLPLSGRNDSLMVRVYGSGNADTLRFLIEDRDGDRFVVTPSAVITWKDEWRTLGVMMSRALPLGASALDYPIALTGIRIDFGRTNLSGGRIGGTLLLDDPGAHYPIRTVAPQVLFDFENGITGWLTPAQSNTAQLKGIVIGSSSLAPTSERAYQGSFAGRWTFVDDAASSVDWDVRMTRGTNSDLGLMLRGSYVGAWVYAEGETATQLQIAIRDGNGLICAGPLFPVRHYGWKLIGTRLDESLFAPYLTAGKITDAGNKFNGFRLRGSNAALSGATRVITIDKLVTSALTVPTGFIAFNAEWTTPLVRLHWVVNSEISINRYAVERGIGGIYTEVGSLAGRGNIDTTVHYEIVDTPPAGVVASYRIRQITNDGGQELSQTLTVNTTTNSVGPHGSLPERFELMQNYPNPFNPSTTFAYALPVESHVQLRVFNVIGQSVGDVVNARQGAGLHRQEWTPSLASGVYFFRIDATPLRASGHSRFVETRPLILLR